mgnify:CR=1 FL=1
MQTVTLKIKLLPPNKGKLEKMARMVETYRQACSWFLEQAETLNTTSRAYLNRETYRQACGLFDLNRGASSAPCLKRCPPGAPIFPACAGVKRPACPNLRE